jgi:hypothetical protein
MSLVIMVMINGVLADADAHGHADAHADGHANVQNVVVADIAEFIKGEVF